MDPTCFRCGEPFYEGSCIWCTCERCGSDLSDGVCLNCNSHSYVQNSFNNSSNISDFYTPPPPSFYCYICGKPSEEGMSCGRCFCNECGCINCMCYTPSAHTSYACDTSVDNYPQNDFKLPYQNSYEQVPFFNDNSFQNTPSFENCGGSFENSYHEPNSCYDSNGFYQPPQTSEFTNNFFEIKSMVDELKEMVNRMTSTPEPYERPMEVPRVEERKFQFCECCMYDDDDDSTITINLNPQNDSIFSPVEPVDSLIMGDEPLDTIPATESDEFNESSVENLVPIQSKSGEISNGNCEFIEDKPSDPFKPELKDSLPDFEKYVFDTAEECEPSPIENTIDPDEIFSDSDDDDSISCGEIEYNDDDDDAEIQDEVLREKLSKVYLLISKIEALNDPPISSPIPVMDSDFLPELEIFRFEETSSGNPTIHADISLPDYECFHFDIDSLPISDNPLRDPLLEDVDLFLAAEDSIPPGIENDENDILSDLLSSRPPAKPPDEVFESNKVIFGVVDESFEQDVPVLVFVFVYVQVRICEK
jgi:hypothetical protein